MNDRNRLDHGRPSAELEREVSELYKRLGQAEPDGYGFESGFSEPAAQTASEDPRVRQHPGAAVGSRGASKS